MAASGKGRMRRVPEVCEDGRKGDDEGSDFEARENAVVCGVCLDELPEDRRAITKCKHIYCEDCIRAVFSRGSKNSPCPMCRTQLVYGEVRMKMSGEIVFPEEEKKIITASVSCVWRYGDEFVRRVGGHDQLTGDSWLAVNVNYFHVGATVDAVPPGHYVAAFRVKRLPQLSFREPLVLFLDGNEKKRVCLHHELDRVGVWQLMILGTIDISDTRAVTASMRAGYDLSDTDSQIHSKGGLVIDCFVLFPPSLPPPTIVLLPDDSRAWSVTQPDRDLPLDFIQLRTGKWRDRHGNNYQLRPTNPISFVWPDGTIQSLHTAIDNYLVWRTTSPNTPEIHWQQKKRNEINQHAFAPTSTTSTDDLQTSSATLASLITPLSRPASACHQRRVCALM